MRAPRVAESSVNMECRLTQIVEVSAEPAGGSLVLGEVLRFHIKDQVTDGFKIDPDRLHAIGRMGGAGSYSRTSSLPGVRFDLTRPKT